MYHERVFQPRAGPLYVWLRDQSMKVTTQIPTYKIILVLKKPLLPSRVPRVLLGSNLLFKSFEQVQVTYDENVVIPQSDRD